MNRIMARIGWALTLPAFLFIASCSEIDPLPLSNASFEVATVSPEIYIPVKFENLSRNADNYKWDFGDGSEASTEIAPIHTYEESGKFIVSLTAFTKDDQMSTETRVIEIGERYLTGMFIINLNMKDGNGNPWDADGSGPDVLIQLGPVDFKTEDEIEGFFVDSLNVGAFETPIGIRTTDLLRDNYKLTNEDFFILLEEVDTVGNNPFYRTMARIEFNPVITEGVPITEIKRENGAGELVILYYVVEEYQFFLEFEIR